MGGYGYSIVKAYVDVPPKWVTFSPKILRHRSHFHSQKISLEGGPVSQKKKKKKVRLAIFEVGKKKP